MDGDNSSDSDYNNNEPPSKKRKMNIFDEYAEVSDDDDESDVSGDDDGGDEMKDFVTRDVTEDGDIGVYRNVDQQDDFDSIREKNIKEKYSNYSSDAANEAREFENKDRYPIPEDPKLWMIRCKPGSERTIASHLLQRYLDRQAQKESLLIFSVVALEHLKGYLYVEADKEPFVRQAIQNLQDIFHSFKIKMVPTKEMPDVLTIPVKRKPLQKGDWVRVKRGIYKGDIAQVYQYNEATSDVLIRIIPRLDIQEWLKKGREDDDDSNKKKRKRPQGKNKPPARFFNKDEILQLEGGENAVTLTRSRDGENLFQFDAQQFTAEGFLHKKVALKTLDVGNISPTFEELQKFQSQQPINTEDDDERRESFTLEQRKQISKLKSKRVVNFAKGDRVIIEEGELMNVIGIVVSVEGETVKIKPIHKEIMEDIIPVSARQLSKYFNLGDHVKVIQGNFESETGFIIKLQDNVAVILSDINQKEMQVLTSDIQLCVDSSSGLKLGNYQLHDFVQLGPSVVGVITRVDREGFEVIDFHGNIKNIKLQEIQHKKNSRRVITKDSANNPVGVGDTVRVTKEGKYKGNQGIIKHIFKNYLFIHSPNYKANSGIFVTTARHCLIMGTSKNQTMGGVHGKNVSKNRISAPTRQRANNRNDVLLHKQVTITQGNWRGYVGIVKDVSKDTVTIVLQTNAQRIQVQRNQVENNENKFTPQSPMNIPNKLPEVSTPRQPNKQTPNTPMTPSFNPGRTPIHPSTPGSDEFDIGNEDSQDDENNFTPDTSYGTPNRYPHTVSTPGHEIEERNITSPSFVPTHTPSTPGFISHPTTPGGYTNMPTTPGYTPIPNTPGYNQVPPTTPGAYKPNTPYGSFSNNQDEDSNWLCENIEVEYEGKVGVVANVYNNECSVRWNDNTQSTMEGSLLTPVPPKKKDKVIVIRGKSKGKRGELMHLDESNEGIVKGELEIEIFPIHHLAKYVA
jgi:transcription elongation factor SPT5